jgi:GT2 family glycosyltransferase
MDVSVVICTYNRSASLLKTLASLADLQVPEALRWELVVVDNNSRDDTSRRVSQFAREHPHLAVRSVVERRQGKSHALNLAVATAQGGLLAFTDDDVVVDPRWLNQLHRLAVERGAMAVGGRIVDTWTTPKPAWYSDAGPYKLNAVIVKYDLGEQVCPITRTMPLGANLAVRREAFEKYGLFDTHLGPTAGGPRRGEDSEFCARLVRAGETILYAPEAVVYHPVERERLDRKYFERWYYLYGKVFFQMNPLPPDLVCWLGVPRFLIRMLATHFIRWQLARVSAVRFYHRLHVFQILGSMVDLRNRRPRNPAGPATAERPVPR